MSRATDISRLSGILRRMVFKMANSRCGTCATTTMRGWVPWLPPRNGLRRSICVGDSFERIRRSFGIRLSHFFLPKPLRHSMGLHNLFPLARVVELDLTHAFSHPVEKELGGSFADATWRCSNLDVIWARRGKPECAWHIRDCANQEPTARLELD